MTLRVNTMVFSLSQQNIAPLPCHHHLAGHRYQGKPSRALRARMRTPEKVSISTWAEKFRRVTEIDSNPGPWRNDLVPHLIKPMDTIGLPYVREVWICAPERAGKTQLLLNTVCWGIDQGAASGNIFWLMPTESDARRAIGERIIPVMRAKDDHGRPGRLAKYLSGYADDTTRGMIRFNHGIRLFPAWANSPASIASYFGRINIADECDKFPDRTSEGTDPITLFKKRARDDRHRSKYVFASTPAQKYIYKGASQAHQVWEMRLRCPDCDELVAHNEEHLDIPADAGVEDVERDGCGLVCPECGSIWNEEQRAAAYYAGRWVCIKGAADPRPQTVGYHMTAFCLPRIPLNEIGAAWLRAKTGDTRAKTAWANGYLAKDYQHASRVREESAILALCDDRPAGVVPATDIAALLLTVDTQKDHFYYVLRAHGYGIDQESWLVAAGMLNSFEALGDMIDNHVYADANGVEYRIEATAIDSGGTKHEHQEHSRTIQVYNWCRTRRAVRPFKGARKGSKPYSMTRLDHYPNGKPMRGGLQLWNVNTNLYKDELDRRLQINIDDPGAFHLHSGYTARQLSAIAKGDQLPPNGLTDYARHMVAEARDDTGQWEPISGRRHDFRDCENYQIILADILKIKHRKKPEPEEEKQPTPQPTPLQQKLAGRRPGGKTGNFATGWKK